MKQFTRELRACRSWCAVRAAGGSEHREGEGEYSSAAPHFSDTHQNHTTANPTDVLSHHIGVTVKSILLMYEVREHKKPRATPEKHRKKIYLQKQYYFVWLTRLFRRSSTSTECLQIMSIAFHFTNKSQTYFMTMNSAIPLEMD